MKIPTLKRVLIVMLTLAFAAAAQAQSPLTNSLSFKQVFNNVAMADQCNFTSECKAIYGNRATDCRDSRSNMSVCYCGSQRCDGSTPTPPPTPPNSFPGRFDLAKDLFLAFYDNKPDADDIHSQAGVATLLADGRFAGIDFYAVLGTYGRQGGAYLNSSSVMNRCYASNWTHAHLKDGPNWTSSLNRVLARALTAFQRGGDLWIMEAGQSDFSADLIRMIKNASGVNTRNRVHIVQHSDYNERQTTQADFSYVNANSDYIRIADGNGSNNGSPNLTTRSSARWNTAISIPSVGGCWAEARRVADENNFSGNGHYENPAIEAGGFDFSDVVEAAWIFGFNDSLTNVDSFFDEFPRNIAPPPPTPPTSPNNATVVPNAIVPLLLDEEG